ncbi:serine protease family S28, partial [Achlya hypogyna]
MLTAKLLVALALPLVASSQIAPPFDMQQLRNAKLGNMSISNRMAENTVMDLWFTDAILDHNDPQSRHWRQRYHYNDAYYGGPGSPVFLYIHGEWEATDYTVTDTGSLMVDLAQKHNAMIVALEHRYYGDSVPNNDQSEVSMRKYLSSQQALADIATFHAFFTKEHGLQGAPWISWGYSYAGMLSAWFKLKYPSLVAGAVASSAPVQAAFDHKAFMEGVTRGLKYNNGQECLDVFKEAFDDLHDLVVAGGEPLRKQFGACGPMTSLKDKQAFEWEMMSYFHGMGMTGTDHGYNLYTVCEYMKDSANGARPVDRLGKWKRAIYAGCAPPDNNGWSWGARSLRQAANPEFGQWTWQTCNEFGFLITASTGDNTPFNGLKYASPENVHKFSPCTTRFHVGADELKANVEATNAEYGGWDIDVENVIFTNGANDPWAGLSVLKQPKNPKSRFVVIEGAAHCEDAYVSHVLGPMKAAQRVIGEAVADFLKDATVEATPQPTTVTPMPTKTTMEPVTTTPKPTTAATKTTSPTAAPT